MRYTVFDFAGTGGVALAMFNTDAVCVAAMSVRCFFLCYCERKWQYFLGDYVWSVFTAYITCLSRSSASLM